MASPAAAAAAVSNTQLSASPQAIWPFILYGCQVHLVYARKEAATGTSGASVHWGRSDQIVTSDQIINCTAASDAPGAAEALS
jgi:hypothetical protein